MDQAKTTEAASRDGSALERRVMQHTMGPWAVSKWRDESRADRLIATVAIVGDYVVGPKFDSPYQVNYESHGSDAADANLVSAAPELLEAANAAWNCIAELPATQARAEVALMLQRAIDRALAGAA